jgi:Fe-S cluster assembly protein SufD
MRAFRESAAALDSGPPWLIAHRRSAWERFAAHGWPTHKDEDWRFTNLAKIAQTSFAPARTAERPEDLADLVAWLRFGGACALVFVNGRYAPRLSCPWPNDDVRLRSLHEALQSDTGALAARIADSDRLSPHVFAALNSAHLEDGAVIQIAPGRTLTTPISLVFVGAGNAGATPSACHPRVLIDAGRGSAATVIEAYGGHTDAAYLTNGVTEIVVAEHARLDHLRIQRESPQAYHLASLSVRLARASRYHAIALDLGASLSRTDMAISLQGEGGECELDGLFMAADDQHTDTHTRIDHAAENTTSREFYRGILDGSARGVFYGLINVHAGAQHTSAFQLNKNLILSPDALVHSTPQLQILADDVRCKHASTTGQIDPAALFYLRSRGLNEQAARGLLSYAFAGDIVGRIQVTNVRRAIELLLRERFPDTPLEFAA